MGEGSPGASIARERTEALGTDRTKSQTTQPGGLIGWFWTRLRRQSRPRPSLALLERITLAPRQTLALVEAEGRRFLVATSAEGSPTFCALDRGTGGRRTAARAIPVDLYAAVATILASLYRQ